MTMQQPRYLADLQSYVESIPYGNVVLTIQRVDRHTTQVETHGTETLRYNDNAECLHDLANFLQGLIDDKHTGDVQFGLEFKDGQIKIMAFKNTRKTSYQK